ncbi:hypothetical protein [Bradyrhizobium sp. CCBAU 45389]|uniref:hypothetical protein n=1 Tax=Bradyrhizobium sp. CCBAU 45389 TaxID=858429 RepID=UPI0023051DFF|nr:hypothetical protein [Bradyrhizobium sp. CCBAU 45389]
MFVQSNGHSIDRSRLGAARADLSHRHRAAGPFEQRVIHFHELGRSCAPLDRDALVALTAKHMPPFATNVGNAVNEIQSDLSHFPLP